MRRVLLPLAYLFLAMIIILITVLLVAYGRGYSYDFKSNRLVVNGLVLLGSAPQGGTVKINGKATHKKTPYRATMEAGNYDFQIDKPGYRSWFKRLSLVASEVTYAQYVILFPEKLHPQQLQTTPPVTSIYSSSDHRHIAYVTAGNEPGLWVLSGDGRQSTKIYAAKSASGDQPAEVVTSVLWSNDGSRLLVGLTTGDKISYWFMTPQSGQTPQNLTDLFGVDLSGAKFNPTNAHELYWISPEGLRRLSIDSQTVSAVLADKVSAYTFAPGEKVIYIQTTPLGKSVWSIDRAGHRQELVQSLAESDSYDLDYSNFLGKDYLAVSPAQTATVTLYRDIFSDNPTAKVVARGAVWAHFNDEGRYLVFHSSTDSGSYDVERDTVTPTQSFGGQLTFFDWFDTYHVLIGVGGRLRLAEYDGANGADIDTQAAAGGQAASSADGKKLFWISPANSNPQLFDLDLKR